VIKTKTKLYGVIGDPIDHSLSPLLHNWFFETFKIDAAYMAFRVKREQLGLCMEGMKAFGIGGLNVTSPHKESITLLVDEKSPEVSTLMAANTIKNDGEKLSAYVTDPLGFIESLGDERDRFAGASVVLFGAGGAAKSVAYALSKLSVHKLVVVNRSAGRAVALAHAARQVFGIPTVETVTMDDKLLRDALSQASIVINTTPLGMRPSENSSILNDFSSLSKRHFVYDLIYNPSITVLLSKAKAMGAVTQNGLDMLIFQGLESLRIWMGDRYEIDSESLNQLRKLLMRESGNYEHD
jgi:shikimate dehydrogenase